MIDTQLKTKNDGAHVLHFWSLNSTDFSQPCFAVSLYDFAVSLNDVEKMYKFCSDPKNDTQRRRFNDPRMRTKKRAAEDTTRRICIHAGQIADLQIQG